MSSNRNMRRSLRASAPRFVQPAAVRVADDGARVLECRVDGYPRPDVVWEKAGAPVPKSRRVHILRTGDRCLLHIRAAEEGGLFSCIATNIVGTATTQLRIMPQTGITEEMNVHKSNILSNTNGLRSRTMAKSSESVAKPQHRKIFRIRSTSGGNRKPRKDEDTVSTRTKPTFTSHIVWNREDLTPSQPLSVHQDIKQLSKSVEDCRRNRRGFLNRVKIPDIFGMKRSDSSKHVNGGSANSTPSKRVEGGLNSSKADTGSSKPVDVTLISDKNCRKRSVDAKSNEDDTEVEPVDTGGMSRRVGSIPDTQVNVSVKSNKSPDKPIDASVNFEKVDPIFSENTEVWEKSNDVESAPLIPDDVDVKSNMIDTTPSEPANIDVRSNKVDPTKIKQYDHIEKSNKVNPIQIPPDDVGGKSNQVESAKTKPMDINVKPNKADSTPIKPIRVNSNLLNKSPNKTFEDINKMEVTSSKKIEGGVKSAETTTDQNFTEKGEKATTTNGEVEIPVQLSTRERIAAYLKRFESNSPSSKEKASQAENKKGPKNVSGSAKKTHTEQKGRTSEDNSFFGKFRRRKSDVLKTNEIQDSPLKLNGSEMVNSSDSELNFSVENVVFITTKTVNIEGVDACENTTVINGFLNGSTESNVQLTNGINGESHSEKPQLDNFDGDSDLGTYEHIDTNLLDSFEEFKTSPIIEDESLPEAKSTDSISQTKDPPVKNNEENSTEFELKENQVPIIHIELSPEVESPDAEEDSLIDFKTDSEVIEENGEKEIPDIFFKKTHKGKIKYSSPLIEEECEALAQNAASDPQRAASACPARIVQGPQSVTVLRGQSVTLAVSFSGHPDPTVLWMKGGRVLCSGGRLSILEGREMSVATVGDVTADDSGKYVVSVENEGGGDSCFASVAVVGFPEPPGGEPTANEVTDHSLVLSWYGSMYDGGSVVTGYQVEMCTLPDKKWYKVASSVNTSCTVLGLSKGQRYTFRVRAENRYGTSHPSKESKIIKLDDFLQDESSEDEEGQKLANPVEVENGTIFTERFDLKEEVGKGRFGTVYRCVEKSCGRPRAAKVIRCLKVKDKEKVRQEIEIMSRLHHPKLMQVLAAFESGRNMIMVMEYISGGELFERVIADDFVLTEQDCILFMRQICNGVAHMHRNNIIHLDLKPENILCKTKSSHKIKIIDFGLARVYKEDESLRVLFGTPEFVAPEVISYEPVCPASDMWSLGVICYVLLSGLSPFMGDSDTETFANITRGDMDFDDEAFDEISQDAKDFISRLLVKNVKNRLSAEECLTHGWLATGGLVQKRPLSTEKLKRFIIRRKWQKSGTAIRALGRMVSLSRSSLGSSCDSYSPLGSPTSSRSRSRSSLLSRSETTDSAESDIFQDLSR